MEASEIKPEAFYVLRGQSLLAAWSVAKRLYSENRMTGDEMRDAAQKIDHFVLDQAIELEDKP